MSHEATAWAIKRKGISPTTKMVLWHLADCHNPSYGCFPSQAYLAQECEIGRTALNEHLRKLEEAGLVRRVRSKDPRTNRQRPTRYILGFEPEFEQEPCSESEHGELETEGEQSAGPCSEGEHGAVFGFDGEPCSDSGQSRVRNPNTNLVREPLREPVREEEDRASAMDRSSDLLCRLRKTLGVSEDGSPGASPWWQDEFARHRVEAWLAAGLTEADILDVAEEHRRGVPEPPDGPKALERAMARAIAGVDAAKPVSGRKPAAKVTPAPASEEDRLAFVADWINSDRYIPPSALNNTTRAQLVARGLVTEERMLARGFR